MTKPDSDRKKENGAPQDAAELCGDEQLEQVAGGDHVETIRWLLKQLDKT